MAVVILCGFGRVTAAWLCYGALINLPPGGLRAALRVTSLEWGEGFCLYMGIIPESFSSGQLTQSSDNHFNLDCPVLMPSGLQFVHSLKQLYVFISLNDFLLDFYLQVFSLFMTFRPYEPTLTSLMHSLCTWQYSQVFTANSHVTTK